MRGGGGRGKHEGPDFGLTGTRKAVERRRGDDEGGSGGALNAGLLGMRREGRRGGGGADARAPFYIVRGGVGRPGIGVERVAVVVRHIGDEGGRFRRGSTWVVVGSDEGGGCSSRYGSGSGTGRWRARTRGGGSGGRTEEEDDRAGPVCQPSTERDEGGTR
jgi:hypothetical protein